MVNWFLRAKHWQLFLLIYGVVIVGQVVLMTVVFTGVQSQSASPVQVFGYLRFFPIVMIMFMLFQFGWFWAVGQGLQKMIRPELRLNVRKFRFFLIVPIAYIIFISGFIVVSANGFIPGPGLILAILPVHLFSMFSIFYCLYFVAKTIKTAELGSEATFGDYIGEFFLVWLFPIGVWIIQPKINRIFIEGRSSE